MQTNMASENFSIAYHKIQSIDALLWLYFMRKKMAIFMRLKE